MTTKKEHKERCAVDWSPAFTVTVREDVRETNRYDEDGERIEKSVFYLVAENTGGDPGTRGARWASPARHEEYASAKLERRHLSRDFDPAKVGWYEIDPCYGSAAWTPAVEARIAYAEREAERWGER
jgi:hypothetical protein